MDIKKVKTEVMEATMSGIGYMIPVVIAGSLIMAIGNIMSGANPVEGTMAYNLYTWGNSLFGYMNVVLAMYVAYRICNKQGLAPGLVVGIIARDTSAGFLGAVIGGLFVGYLVRGLNKIIKLPSAFQSAKSLVVLPFLSCLVTFFGMNYILVPICSAVMNLLVSILTAAQGLNPFIFGGLIAGFCIIGMGTPPGWAAFMVCQTLLDQTGSYQPFTALMLGGISGCLGIALAALAAPKKFTEEERAGIPSLIAGWICLVTEMQIPYVLRDPKRLYPSLFIGGFIGGGLIYLLDVEVPAVHGGMLVAVLANSIPKYLLCIFIAALIVAVLLCVLKKNVEPEEEES